MTDKRLLKCAEFVSGGNIAVDVGTDHAYLPVYLVEEGISPAAIACDIKDGPLAAAKATVSASGLDEKISIVKSDGLDEVNLSGVSDVIIAGMGGEMIVSILERCEYLKSHKVNLVLQPMTKAHVLRKYLFENGFSIKQECAVTSGSFCYTVINAEFSGEKISVDDFSLYVGKISNATDDDRKYLENLSRRLRTASLGMKISSDKSPQADRLNDICKRIDSYLKGAEK
ncbi:MAG: class I SAM-dependent methyltransferase [Ruminococcus sp.]|nr:class I SAM-dependent methyltransferase [Ruminococcus sp.]